jgi:hypothetical protein
MLLTLIEPASSGELERFWMEREAGTPACPTVSVDGNVGVIDKLREAAAGPAAARSDDTNIATVKTHRADLPIAVPPPRARPCRPAVV